MTEPTPAEILSIKPDPTPPLVSTESKQTSIGWIVFWLVGFTPIGCYMVWQKTSWPVRVKLIVITISLTIFVGLLIESELVTTQIAGSLGL